MPRHPLAKIVHYFSPSNLLYNDTAVVQRMHDLFPSLMSEQHAGGHLFDVRGRSQICIQRHRHRCYAPLLKKKLYKKKIKTLGTFDHCVCVLRVMTTTTATYDPRFQVPGNMQVVGPSLSSKTTWLTRGWEPLLLPKNRVLLRLELATHL